MQVYRANATTNLHIRLALKQSHLPLNILAEKYKVSEKTVLKWKKRESPNDCSSAPHTIQYTLSVLKQQIIQATRRCT